MGNFITLTDLPRELREHDVAISYGKAWRAATEGRIPAMKIGSRWHVQRHDLSVIAEFFTPADVEG